MIKMTILYREPADQMAFERFYVMNLKLLERIPNVVRREVSHIYGSPDGPSPYFREYVLYFEDRDTMDAALTSHQGMEAGKNLMSRAAELVTVYFSEVYEEEGGSTPQDKGHIPADVALEDGTATAASDDAEASSKPTVVDLDEQIL